LPTPALPAAKVTIRDCGRLQQAPQPGRLIASKVSHAGLRRIAPDRGTGHQQAGPRRRQAVRRTLRQILEGAVQQVGAVGQVQVFRHALAVGDVIQFAGRWRMITSSAGARLRFVHLGQDAPASCRRRL
jgi:hypothetical protein